MNIHLRVFLMLVAIISGLAEAQASSCAGSCDTTFGTLLGQSFSTNAYSNCNEDCVKNEDNYLTLPHLNTPVFTGMKWQCVEYARRWLIENKGVTFGDVKYAYNIWDLPYAEKVGTHEHLPLLRFKNKEAKEPPKVGDLLINGTELAITGHVSVVVGVEQDAITIAEQNYFNRPWEGKHYARRLLLDKDEHGHYRVVDDGLIGWVRM